MKDEFLFFYNQIESRLRTLNSTVQCLIVSFEYQVLDENDNNPYFESNVHEFKVREDVPIGTSIAKIVARDADSGEYGKITYLLDRISTQVSYFYFFPDK